jgi:hypothetical protein
MKIIYHLALIPIFLVLSPFGPAGALSRHFHPPSLGEKGWSFPGKYGRTKKRRALWFSSEIIPLAPSNRPVAAVAGIRLTEPYDQNHTITGL